MRWKRTRVMPSNVIFDGVCGGADGDGGPSAG